MSACIVRSANPIGFLHFSHKHIGTGLHFSHRFRTEFAHGSHKWGLFLIVEKIRPFSTPTGSADDRLGNPFVYGCLFLIKAANNKLNT